MSFIITELTLHIHVVLCVWIDEENGGWRRTDNGAIRGGEECRQLGNEERMGVSEKGSVLNR
jgi:hypothetical protein